MENILNTVLNAISEVLKDIEANIHDLLVSKSSRTFNVFIENTDVRERLWDVLLAAGYNPEVKEDILSYTVPKELSDKATPVYLVSKDGIITEVSIYQEKNEWLRTGIYVIPEGKLSEYQAGKLLKTAGIELCDDGWGTAKIGSIVAVSNQSIVRQYTVPADTNIPRLLELYQEAVENALDDHRSQFIMHLNQVVESEKEKGEVEADFLQILKALGTKYEDEGNHSWRIFISKDNINQNGLLVVNEFDYNSFWLTVNVECAITVLVVPDASMDNAEDIAKHFIGGTKDYRIRRSTISDFVFFIE